MEYIKKDYDSVIEYIDSLDDGELVSLHNEYCQSISASDDEIYYNDEDFFNTFFPENVLEAVRAVCFGDYRYSDEYVVFDGYANLESSNLPDDWIDKQAIANDILDNENNYYGIELEEPNEEEEEEEEDEEY
jgi:hypothetical protein